MSLHIFKIYGLKKVQANTIYNLNFIIMIFFFLLVPVHMYGATH